MRNVSPLRSLPDWLTYSPLCSPVVTLAYVWPVTFFSVPSKFFVDSAGFFVVAAGVVTPPLVGTAETSLIHAWSRPRRPTLEPPRGDPRRSTPRSRRRRPPPDRKSTRLNSSHANISYAVFCLKKKH